MSLKLKQSTQYIDIIGPFLDKTDGVTEEAGLAGAGTEISKAGAAFGAGPVLGTHDSDGWYPVTLTTTHTNTLGPLKLKVHDAATHLPVWVEYEVVVANVYDALYGAGTDKLQVDLIEIGGDAQSGTDLKDFVDAGYDPTGNTVDANVTKFGGNAGTFGAGIPAVNTTLIEGVDATTQLDAAASGGAMAVARSTGALIGTDETAGVSVATGASSTGDQKDLLGDATSRGTVHVYAKWTSAAGATGLMRVTLSRNRITAQPYEDEVIDFPADLAGGKKFLGSFPASRYMRAIFENRSSLVATNVAVLYELEKEG